MHTDFLIMCFYTPVSQHTSAKTAYFISTIFPLSLFNCCFQEIGITLKVHTSCKNSETRMTATMYFCLFVPPPPPPPPLISIPKLNSLPPPLFCVSLLCHLSFTSYKNFLSHTCYTSLSCQHSSKHRTGKQLSPPSHFSLFFLHLTTV